MTPKELSRLFYSLTRGSEFQREVAILTYEYECEQRFTLVKRAMKLAGYKVLYVGSCSHWNDTTLGSNLLIGEPCTHEKRRFGDSGFPLIWDIPRPYFQTACGGCLGHADNIFLDVSLPQIYVGRHDL